MSSKEYNWFAVEGADNGPGQWLAPMRSTTVSVNEKRFCVARVGDKYYAVDDQCPHAGASMGGGKCTAAAEIVCPLHQIRFSLIDGKNTSGEGYKVKTYPLKWQQEQLYIGLPQKMWYQFWK